MPTNLRQQKGWEFWWATSEIVQLMSESWEVWTYQLSSQGLFPKWSTIHITGFIGEVFESVAADKINNRK